MRAVFTRIAGVLSSLLALVALPQVARAQDGAAAPAPAPAPPMPRPRVLDVGARFALQRPVGAFDAGTHATDVSFGAVSFSLDATLHLPSSAAWAVELGALGTYAPTIPTLCTDTHDCIASVGHDWELIALARARGPRVRFFWPEFELGTGWSWSSRSLVDKGSTATRRWSGPVLVRTAIIPTVRLGARTRLGLVLGGSIARSSTFSLEAPGVERRGLDGARLHGTFDLGLRFGVDFGP